jgi:hypothetical protein
MFFDRCVILIQSSSCVRSDPVQPLRINRPLLEFYPITVVGTTFSPGAGFLRDRHATAIGLHGKAVGGQKAACSRMFSPVTSGTDTS